MKVLVNQDAMASEWCLKHWTVFAFFKFVEPVIKFSLGWFPFYLSLKLLFFIWLYFPIFEGSLFLYDQIFILIDKMISISIEEFTNKFVEELENITGNINNAFEVAVEDNSMRMLPQTEAIENNVEQTLD